MGKAVLTSWKGFHAQHRWEDLSVIAGVIVSYRPATVVELGTDRGGFAAFLADTVAPWGGRVYTLDIEIKYDHAALTGKCPNLTARQLDVLDKDVETVRAMLSGSVMLYADNGNKTRELELYAPVLPAGALLGVHDYQDEVDPAWVEPFLAGLGYRQERHAEFEALMVPVNYPVSLTRMWVRERCV